MSPNTCWITAKMKRSVDYRRKLKPFCKHLQRLRSIGRCRLSRSLSRPWRFRIWTLLTSIHQVLVLSNQEAKDFSIHGGSLRCLKWRRCVVLFKVNQTNECAKTRRERFSQPKVLPPAFWHWSFTQGKELQTWIELLYMFQMIMLWKLLVMYQTVFTHSVLLILTDLMHLKN